MRSMFLYAACLCAASLVSGATLAEPANGVNDDGRTQVASNATTEFTSANGRLLGSATKIGATTYFTGPDGRVLATSTVVDGRKVFKSY